MRLKFFFLIGSCIALFSTAHAQSVDFTHHGNFKRMMHTGDTKGQVLLSALPASSGYWGVGALAGLKGEIIQVDGKFLVSLGTDPKGAVHPPASTDSAVLWASGQVKNWDSVTLPTDMTQAQFESFFTQQATERKIDLTQPFVFRVTGSYAHLIWHVVTGEAPTGSHGGHSPHGSASGQTGHGAHGGHANQKSGMKLFPNPVATGQLVGVYSGDKLEGVVSHPGEKFHLHYIDNDLKVSGHVDQYSVKAGAVLMLPKMLQPSQHTHDHHHQNSYAEFKSREIKALSAQQVDDLKAGKGMSLALPAELNGYPGPSHTLELASELKLSDDQKISMKALFDAMSKEAKQIGLEVIEAERKLDDLFKNKTVNAQSLREATQTAANEHAKLRASHLRYHLETIQILNSEQIAIYNKLRGY